jgi:hypothetical protein
MIINVPDVPKSSVVDTSYVFVCGYDQPTAIVRHAICSTPRSAR